MTEQERQVEVDYETYKSLLDLWAKENLLFSPLVFALVWLGVLILSLSR